MVHFEATQKHNFLVLCMNIATSVTAKPTQLGPPNVFLVNQKTSSEKKN